MAKTSEEHKHQDFRTKIRILLNLWDLGALETGVKQGELNQRIKAKSESQKLYNQLYEILEKEGAIARTSVRNYFRITLTSQGLEILAEGLKNPQFLYGSRQQPRVKDVNAILKWLQQLNLNVTKESNQQSQNQSLTSYEEFKKVALAVYDRLNQDYNLDHLVPIYRIRREIGDRISRSQFSDWLLEMQTKGLVQLIGGEMTDPTPDKVEDSVTTKLGAIRYYVKRLLV